MIDGWQLRKIGEVCDLATGGTPSTTNPAFFGGDIKWLVSGDIHRREILDCEGRITEAGMKASNAKLLPINSVMIALNGQGKTRGTVALLRTSATCNQSMVSITPRASSGLLAEFLFANLHGRYEEIRRMTSDADNDRRGLNMGMIREIKVPIAPLTEQRRIVAILDEAFDGIATAKANAEKNLLNARELFTSKLERIFTEPSPSWRRVALEGIGTTQTGSTPKSSEPENLGDYLPFVKPGDFNRDGSITFDNEGLSETGARKARHVNANSALMVCIGATIGKAGFSDREIATNQQVNAWTPTAEVSSKFIYYQMTTADFQRRVRQGAGQATLPIINKSKWSALVVVVPQTMDEQCKIVSDLDALLAESMNLEALYERKLAALDELKKSLLRQAFIGKL